MAADGDPIRYACVADDGEILVGIMSGGVDDEEEGQEEELAALAARCVAAAPAYHRHYYHTARGRSYGFLIDGSFAYFVIYGDSLGWAPALRFLRRVRTAFLKSAGGADFAPMLRYLMQMPPSRSLRNGEDHQLAHRKDGNVACGEAAVFGRPVKYEKISRELSVRDSKMDSDRGEDTDGERGSFSEKGGGGGGGGGREMARRVWRRHVKVVLVIDFLVCLVLFGVWLSICNGFQCITG